MAETDHTLLANVCWKIHLKADSSLNSRKAAIAHPLKQHADHSSCFLATVVGVSALGHVADPSCAFRLELPTLGASIRLAFAIAVSSRD